MAKYTIELRRVCDLYSRQEVESWFNSYNIEDYLLPDQIATLAKFPNIWSKERLAKKIVNHYYMREIGFETPALFKHYAKVTMDELMQEKLPLIYTLALDYDPLVNVDYTETFKRTAEHQGNTSSNSTSNNTQHQEGENNGTSNSTSANTADGLNINNDTPQGNINKQNLETGAYASSVNQTNSSSNITDNTTTNNNNSTDLTSNTSGNLTEENSNNTNEEYTRNFKGNQGISATYQRMIQLFRDNIIAVDRDIIRELNTLFMGLY